MKSLIMSALFMLVPEITSAADFADFQELFNKGVAPTSFEEVETFLSYQTQCTGKYIHETTASDVLVVENVLVKNPSGPAFPEVRKKALLLGKSQNTTIIGLNYAQQLNANGLSLTTVKTVGVESCDYYDGFGELCSTDYTVVKDIKLRVKMNHPYLVYHDTTHNVYGYCW